MTSQTAATERATPQALEALYNRITGDEDARVCKDIPESACHDQPRNFFAYLGANLLGKVADEIASAKLVIPWLFGALGVPAVFTGLLVPIREAGVLGPQLAVAAAVRGLPIRKGVWLLGAVLSAASLFAMAVAALSLNGTEAGLGHPWRHGRLQPGAWLVLGIGEGCARQDGLQEPARGTDGLECRAFGSRRTRRRVCDPARLSPVSCPGTPLLRADRPGACGRGLTRARCPDRSQRPGDQSVLSLLGLLERPLQSSGNGCCGNRRWAAGGLHLPSRDP